MTHMRSLHNLKLMNPRPMYLTHRIPKSVPKSLHQPIRRYNSTILNQPTTSSQKDCLRLAFIYGACGTFASYLSMQYDGRVLVFKWSVPSPERFIFHTWCWSVAGTTSWALFWTKPDALLRVAGSRIKFGLTHGIQTTGLALMLSFSTLGFFSIYFDVQQWKFDYGEWQQSVMAQSHMNINSNSSSLMTDNTVSSRPIGPNNALIEEAANEQGELEANIVNMDELKSVSGVEIINQHLEKEQQNMRHTEREPERKSNKERPVLTYQMIADHLYEPTKLFFMCNAPIWLFCGSFTGLVAARILTNGIVLNPVNIVAGFGSLCLADGVTESGLELMECDDDDR